MTKGKQIITESSKKCKNENKTREGGVLSSNGPANTVLVFMDIRLPGENGLELTQKVKTQYPDIVVIILTSYDLPYRQVSSQYADYFFSKDSSTAESIFTGVESIFPTRV
jgi:DNA-binding NarL/FixJ family response regulator